MPFISYFDLLGTKGFCENSETYYKNISAFYFSIKSLSRCLGQQGKVGVFSDCAYAESNDLEYLLDFLVELRDRLNSEGLFFNAYVKYGKLGIEDVWATKENGEKRKNLFGVVLKSSSIAELYISQSNFKGVGICIDDDKRIIEKLKTLNKYKLSDCIYISKKKFDDGTEKYVPIGYMDIAYREPIYGDKDIEDGLGIFYKTFYSAYIKSPKYGSYYISALTNYIRSYQNGFDWDIENGEFNKAPIVFKSVCKMISDYYEEVKNLPGIDYLVFILLDTIYNSKDLNIEEKKSITIKFAQYPSIKNKFINTLEDIPKELFTKTETANNREMFIRFCQNDFSKSFAQKLLSD